MSVGFSILFALESSSDSMLFDQSAWSNASLLSFTFFNSIKFSDTTSSFGTKSSIFGLIGKSGNLFVTFLDKGKGESFNIRSNNASSNGFSLSFSFSFGSISWCSRGEEKFYSVIAEDTLFHGKTVFIEASVNFEDITLELLSEGICFNFLSHSLFEKDSASIIIIDFKGFGGSVCGIWNAELNRF